MALPTYESVANMKAVLGITGSAEDDNIEALLSTASAHIDNYCNRTFIVPTVATPREYFIEDSCDVYIDDFQSVSAVAVTYGASSIPIPSSQYQLLPRYINEVKPFYSGLRRLSGGFPISWLWGTMPGAVVAVTAIWAYQSTVPAPIVEACRIITARLYQREVAKYGNDKGMGAGGISVTQSPRDVLDSTVIDLLNQYKALRLA